MKKATIRIIKIDSIALIIKQMKRYFRNLWLALTGSNPFRSELDEIRDKYEKTAAKVEQLSELYYNSLERWEKAEARTESVVKKLHDYENLIENLRERIVNKDILLERTKTEYQERIERYTTTIDGLTQQLEKGSN